MKLWPIQQKKTIDTLIHVCCIPMTITGGYTADHIRIHSSISYCCSCAYKTAGMRVRLYYQEVCDYAWRAYIRFGQFYGAYKQPSSNGISETQWIEYSLQRNVVHKGEYLCYVHLCKYLYYCRSIIFLWLKPASGRLRGFVEQTLAKIWREHAYGLHVVCSACLCFTF